MLLSCWDMLTAVRNIPPAKKQFSQALACDFKVRDVLVPI